MGKPWVHSSESAEVQGDHSGCSWGCADIKTKIAFYYNLCQYNLKNKLNGHSVVPNSE